MGDTSFLSEAIEEYRRARTERREARREAKLRRVATAIATDCAGNGALPQKGCLVTAQKAIEAMEEPEI